MASVTMHDCLQFIWQKYLNEQDKSQEFESNLMKVIWTLINQVFRL